MSDLNNAFQHLRQLLVKMKYKKSICVEKICDGVTSELLPLLHYGLLSFSAELARDISRQGYDLFGKNDQRFTEGVYSLCRNYFGYNPVLQCHQFLTAKGFAYRKISFVAQTLECALNKHKQLVKAKQQKTSQKISWSNTQMSKKVDSAIANSKKKAQQEKKERESHSNPHLRSIKAKTKKKKHRPPSRIETPSFPSFEMSIPHPTLQHSDASWEARSPPQPTMTSVPTRVEFERSEEKTEPVFAPMNRSNESMIDAPFPATTSQDAGDKKEFEQPEYNPTNYIQTSNATMELSNPDLNPYLHMQPLVDPFSRSPNPETNSPPESHEFEATETPPKPILLSTIPESQVVSSDQVTDSVDDEAPPAPPTPSVHETKEPPSFPPSSRIPPPSNPRRERPRPQNDDDELISLRSIVDLLQAMSSRIDRLEERFDKVDQIEARLVVMEGRMRYFEQHKENVPPSPQSDEQKTQPSTSNSGSSKPPSHRPSTTNDKPFRPTIPHRSSSSSPSHQTIGSSPIPVSSVSLSAPAAPSRPRSTPLSSGIPPRTSPFPHIPSWMAPTRPGDFSSHPRHVPTFNALGQHSSSSDTRYSVARLRVPVTSSSSSSPALFEVAPGLSPVSNVSNVDSNSSLTGFIKSLQSRLEASEKLLESTRPRSPFG